MRSLATPRNTFIWGCFQNRSRKYCYRTGNKDIRRYDVVKVPVPDGTDNSLTVSSWLLGRNIEKNAFIFRKMKNNHKSDSQELICFIYGNGLLKVLF